MDLTIIIPVYNGEKYIQDCLQSIIQEKNKKIEIIIINDGSTDKTKDICQEYEKKDKRIKLINNSNHGVSYSRNQGITVATGRYIMFVDSDDVLDKNWYSLVKESLFSDIDYIIFSNKIQEKTIEKEELLNYIVGCNKNKICLAAPFSKLFKKDMLLKNKICFDEKIMNGEDMVFNIETLLFSTNFFVKKGSYYQYRITSDSVTHNFKEKLFESDEHFHNKLSYILKKNVTQLEQEKICSYCYTNSLIMFISRISNLNDYKVAKKYFIKLGNRDNLKIGLNSLYDIKEKIILILFKIKQYYLIYYIYHTYSKKIQKKVKNNFINI